MTSADDLRYLEQAEAHADEGPLGEQAARCILEIALRSTRALLRPIEGWDLPITDEWLSAAGFKWHQLDRQPDKHWLLWLGDAAGLFTSYEDIGIELAPCRDESWFCWLRGDAAGRYHRFIHLRPIGNRGDVAKLVEAITGHPWTPANHIAGSARTPEQAARIRESDARLDRRLQAAAPNWDPVEADPTAGRPLAEHLWAHAEARRGK